MGDGGEADLVHGVGLNIVKIIILTMFHVPCIINFMLSFGIHGK